MVSVTFPSNCSGQQNAQMYVPPAGYAKLQLGLAVDYCSAAARVSAVASEEFAADPLCWYVEPVGPVI